MLEDAGLILAILLATRGLYAIRRDVQSWYFARRASRAMEEHEHVPAEERFYTGIQWTPEQLDRAKRYSPPSYGWRTPE